MHRPVKTGALVALAAAALTLPALLPPASSQAPGEITFLYEITNDTAQPPNRFEAFDASAVGVFDLDGDGVMEIFAHNDNNRAYVFDGGTGTLVAELTTNHPRPWDARELNGISVGDVNGNKVPDIVIANSVGWVTAFEARPPAEPTAKLEFVKLWEHFVDPTKMDPQYFEKHPGAYEEWTGFAGLDGAAFLADVDGDGKDEVFVQTDNVPSHFALNSDGSVRWWTDWSDGNGNPVVDDLDKDGRLEAVFASDGGRVYVYDASKGTVRCTFDAKAYGARPASISVSPRLADVTGDGKKEIVFGTRQAIEDKSDPEWYKKQHANYFAITSSCNVLWQKSFEWGNPHLYMHPAPVDVDGDGKLDLVFQDWNTIGHKPGNWEVTGKSNLFAVKGSSGELIWRLPVETYWSNKDIAVADVVGDTAPEILVVAPRAGVDGITLVSLQGKIVGFVPAGDGGWDVSRGPAVGDLDGDGTMEIMIPIYRKAEGCPQRNLDVGCREGALRIFHTQKTTEPVWDGVFLYSRAYDYLGKERRAPVPQVEVSAPRATPGNLAIQVEGDRRATNLFVKRVGTTEWVGLPPVGENRFEAVLEEPPRTNETFFVRVTLEDHRVAYATINWFGQGDGAVQGFVTQTSGKPIGGAQVNVTTGNGRTVKTVQTNGDGSYRVDLPPGNYTLVARADGRIPASADVTVGAGELVRARQMRLEREPLLTPEQAVPGLAIVAVIGTAAVGAFAVSVARRRRAR